MRSAADTPPPLPTHTHISPPPLRCPGDARPTPLQRRNTVGLEKTLRSRTRGPPFLARCATCPEHIANLRERTTWSPLGAAGSLRRGWIHFTLRASRIGVSLAASLAWCVRASPETWLDCDTLTECACNKYCVPWAATASGRATTRAVVAARAACPRTRAADSGFGPCAALAVGSRLGNRGTCRPACAPL